MPSMYIVKRLDNLSPLYTSKCYQKRFIMTTLTAGKQETGSAYQAVDYAA